MWKPWSLKVKYHFQLKLTNYTHVCAQQLQSLDHIRETEYSQIKLL